MATSSSPTGEWHSIRPWTPRLFLTLREITSVSATFILSSTFNDDEEVDNHMAALRIADDEELGLLSEGFVDKSVVSEALTRGLAVTVNGVPSQRVLIRIDDKTDDAVIIIFGLLPGRQYDIELGLVQGAVVKREVQTKDSESNGDSEDSNETLHSAHSSPSTSPSRTLPSSTPPPQESQQQTIEDHLNHLQHSLSLLTSERDSLTASLKSTRRDSQRADAALRSEIEVLKRTSDKNTTSEHRARQKILALQESVKRANGSSSEIEDEVERLESEMPGLLQKKEEVEEVWVEVKGEVERCVKRWEEEKEIVSRRIEGIRVELVSVGKLVERLGAKKERLEEGGEELEEQIRQIESELGNIREAGLTLWSPSQSQLNSSSNTPSTTPFSSPPHSFSLSTALSSRAMPFEPRTSGSHSLTTPTHTHFMTPIGTPPSGPGAVGSSRPRKTLDW